MTRMDIGLFQVHHNLEPWPYSDPPTIEPYEFERFDSEKWRRWMVINWPISLITSFIYVVLIFGGQRFMRLREPFNLKPALALWNLCLAAFSICGFVRTAPELYQVVTGPNGLHRSVCVRDILNESSIFWAWLFTWSKLFELGDTAFLVLRKKPLHFLHWYHHVTVLIFCFADYPSYDPCIRIFGVLNLGVHGVMYTYFGLKALKFGVPRGISIAITSLQMSQMVIGISVNLYAIYVKNKGGKCARSEEGLNRHLLMYGSYFILFANFYYRTYVVKKKPIAMKKLH